MTKPLTLSAADRSLLILALRESVRRWPHDEAARTRLDTADWLEGLQKMRQSTQRVAMTDAGLMDTADCLTYYVVAQNEVTSEALNLLTRLAEAPSAASRVARNLALAGEHLGLKGER